MKSTPTAYPSWVLHEVTPDGGLGFCHAVVPDLLPADYHGPLVIALDSNVLIDLQVHGRALLDDDLMPANVAADRGYMEDLLGLADIINVWLLRDIRFVVTPRSKSDTRRGVTKAFLDWRLPSVEALADSLAFQFGDWDAPVPSDGERPPLVGDETGLLPGADRDLVLEAQSVGAHVFLTRDRRILERATLVGPALALRSPRELADELSKAKIQPLLGGLCGAPDCPYREWSTPAPDMGKWTGLMSIFEGDDRTDMS